MTSVYTTGEIRACKVISKCKYDLCDLDLWPLDTCIFYNIHHEL